MASYYRQSWMYVARLKRYPGGRYVYTLCQWLCGHLTGHEISRTEWGYGGGPLCDVWCRWCDFFSQIPLAEHPHAQEMLGRLPPLSEPFEVD